MTDLCVHGNMICSRCVEITDAARRMSERLNLMILCCSWDQLVHSCMTFYLDDGQSNGVLYPDRKTALRYQLRPCAVFYFRNAMGGTNPKDCQIFLNMSREAYRNNRTAWVDVDSPDLIMSNRSYDYLSGRRFLSGRRHA